jgi:hypothetical protein
MDDAWVAQEGDDDEEDELEFDDDGWLSSRSCPSIPAAQVFGRSIDFNNVTGDVCTFFAVTSALVMLGAAFACARIIGET